MKVVEAELLELTVDINTQLRVAGTLDKAKLEKVYVLMKELIVLSAGKKYITRELVSIIYTTMIYIEVEARLHTKEETKKEQLLQELYCLQNLFLHIINDL